MKTTATQKTVIKAISLVNEKRGFKLELNRADQKGKWFNFTLKSESGIPGIVSLGEKIYKGFQWKDRNIGSVIRPMYFSECSI